MRYVLITILEQVGTAACAAIPDTMTTAELIARLGAAPVATPAPPAADPNLPWWQQRPFDPEWIVRTISEREKVSYEPTDAEHLREQPEEQRAAYIAYLEKYYKERAAD